MESDSPRQPMRGPPMIPRLPHPTQPVPSGMVRGVTDTRGRSDSRARSRSRSHSGGRGKGKGAKGGKGQMPPPPYAPKPKAPAPKQSGKRNGDGENPPPKRPDPEVELRLDAARRYGHPEPIPKAVDAQRTYWELLFTGPKAAVEARPPIFDFRPPCAFAHLAAGLLVVNRADRPREGNWDHTPYGAGWLFMTGHEEWVGFDNLLMVWPTVFLYGYTGFNLFRVSPRVNDIHAMLTAQTSPLTRYRSPNHLARATFHIYGLIRAVNAGGILWSHPLDEHARNLARYLFLHQFGAFLELFWPNCQMEVVGLDLEFPQVYTLRCPCCGDFFFADFWGFSIRSENLEHNPCLTLHRCDILGMLINLPPATMYARRQLSRCPPPRTSFPGTCSTGTWKCGAGSGIMATGLRVFLQDWNNLSWAGKCLKCFV